MLKCRLLNINTHLNLGPTETRGGGVPAAKMENGVPRVRHAAIAVVCCMLELPSKAKMTVACASTIDISGASFACVTAYDPGEQ